MSSSSLCPSPGLSSFAWPAFLQRRAHTRRGGRDALDIRFTDFQRLCRPPSPRVPLLGSGFPCLSRRSFSVYSVTQTHGTSPLLLRLVAGLLNFHLHRHTWLTKAGKHTHTSTHKHTHSYSRVCVCACVCLCVCMSTRAVHARMAISLWPTLEQAVATQNCKRGGAGRQPQARAPKDNVQKGCAPALALVCWCVCLCLPACPPSPLSFSPLREKTLWSSRAHTYSALNCF